MHRSTTAWLAGSFLALVAGHGSASAQGVGVQIYVTPPGVAEVEVYPSPGYGRVYGYGPADSYDGYVGYDSYVVQRPRYRYRGGCGTYRYWDGNHCVDARFISPY